MKVCELVAQFLAEQGVRHVFGVNGGANLWMIHACYENENLKFIPTAHEQGASFSADAVARLRGLGVAMATSGPGATNLITGIAASFYDSVPTLFITGQVTTSRFGRKYGVRQYGFQETPITEIVRPITKYAVCVEHPDDILYDLQAAVWIARQDRKGPVLLDIPDDVQRMEVNPDHLRTFRTLPTMHKKPHPDDVNTAAQWLKEAKHPVIIWGAGMRNYRQLAWKLLLNTRIPVVCTWGAIDCMHSNYTLMAGPFGTHGTRAANFAVQNADLIVSLGSRLDTKATGTASHFARGARIVMVDVDETEIGKFNKLDRHIDLPINADVGEFLQELGVPEVGDISEWQNRVIDWKSRYVCNDDPSWTGQRPYALMKEIAKWTTPDDVIVSDTGTALGYVMQGYPFKGERFLHAFNNTPMGYGLPAAIGAAFATGRRVVLVTGDGSLMMSLSELATVARWNLPIKIILLNNGGHAMCRYTEKQWFGDVHCSTDIASGLGMPHWSMIPSSFKSSTALSLNALFNGGGGLEHGVYVADIDPTATLIPQARFGQPIEDADPQLPRDEFRQQMIVPPLEIT